MNPIHLNAVDHDTLIAGLIVAGIAQRAEDGYVTLQEGYVFAYLGIQARGTGEYVTGDEGVEQEVYELLPGVWAGLFGPLTEEQLAVLPVVNPQPAEPMVTL